MGERQPLVPQDADGGGGAGFTPVSRADGFAKPRSLRSKSGRAAREGVRDKGGQALG